jgi:electron transport complex protein RnfC
VFDDPWLAADRCLCAERTDAVAEGAVIAARAAGAEAVILAVSSNEKALGGALLKASKVCGGTAGLVAFLAFTGSRYPQHSAWELSAVLRRYLKDAGLEEGGLVFIGPATAAAAYDAVVRRKPPLARYIAVGGSAVRAPAVLRARVGVRIGSLFDECGGLITGRKGGLPVLVIGSPLMGRAVSSLDEPILRTTRSVFARKRTVIEAALASSRLLAQAAGILAAPPCMGCGECRSACPAGLDPEAIFKELTARARNGGAGEAPPDGCFGCGCCEAVCPSRLPLCSAMNRCPQPEAAK